MSTNYYFHETPLGERRHIGVSATGWCFLLHVYPAEGITDLADWERLLSAPNNRIKNEYGETITKQAMREIITVRSWPGMRSTAKPLSPGVNEGPHGLLRAKVDGVWCVAHGAGTWDCIVGEFF